MAGSCAVFFNLDGTLTENTLDYEAVYQDAVEQAGLSELADSYDEYTDRFFHYFQNGWAFPRRQAICDLLDDRNIDDVGTSDAFAEAWEEQEAEQTTFRSGASGAVQTIGNQFDVGVLTNGTSRLQRMKLDRSGLTDHFDAVLISAEVGVSKPNADMFETAKGMIDADTYILVSHDLRRDILPAKRAGFKTVLLVQDGDLPDNPQMQELVDAQIEMISELPDVAQDLCNT